MPFLVPIVLYGWLLVTYILFTQKKVEVAILLSVIGGTMFLPTATFDLPLITYSKNTAISIGILLSLAITGKSKGYRFHFCITDIFVLSWCFLGTMMTSLINGLGFYDGIFRSIGNILTWGVYYWAGRKFFSSNESHRYLTYYILIGSLIYLPLCLIEIRLSPQLNYWIYGFYPHSFLQHIRNGGFRPMIFMQHGLMVSLWMAAGTLISFTYWLEGTYKKIYNVPIKFIFMGLFVTTIITKSSGAAILMLIGLGLVFLYHKRKMTILVKILLIFIPFYLIFRIMNVIATDDVIDFISQHFNAERTQSLWFRMFQEDLYVKNMSGHKLFGWGGWSRSAPVDPRTGRLLIVRDSMWLGIYSEFGYIGLLSTYATLLAGPWNLYRKNRIKKLKIDSFILTIVVLLFCLDSLLNSMMNPVYILCAGVLVSKAQTLTMKKKRPVTNRV
jgi:hypothetical protein